MVFIEDCLKDKIENVIRIPKSKIKITGWMLPPNTDSDVLRVCSNLEKVNHLTVLERKNLEGT